MRFTFTALFLADAIGAPLAVQAQDHEGHHPPTPLVDQTFTIPSGEFVRVILTGGTTYRVEISGRGLQLRIAPLESGVQAPLVQPLLLGESQAGTSLYTVKPRTDAIHEVRTTGGTEAQPVRVRISVEPRPEPKDS